MTQRSPEWNPQTGRTGPVAVRRGPEPPRGEIVGRSPRWFNRKRKCRSANGVWSVFRMSGRRSLRQPSFEAGVRQVCARSTASQSESDLESLNSRTSRATPNRSRTYRCLVEMRNNADDSSSEDYTAADVRDMLRSVTRSRLRISRKETAMARKTVRVSDISGEEIPEGRGATVRITFADARRGARELDVTDAEAEKLGGRQVARRGRRPKTV
jgi:hypothetical protein